LLVLVARRISRLFSTHEQTLTIVAIELDPTTCSLVDAVCIDRLACILRGTLNFVFTLVGTTAFEENFCLATIIKKQCIISKLFPIWYEQIKY